MSGERLQKNKLGSKDLGVRRPVDMDSIADSRAQIKEQLEAYFNNLSTENREEARLQLAAALFNLFEHNSLESKIAMFDVILEAMEGVAITAAEEAIEDSAANTMTRVY